MPESTVVFSGPFAQCLKHYAKCLERIYSVKNRVQGRRPLAEFTGAPDNSVYRWLAGSSAIEGERYLRTLYFLEAQRYEIVELRMLPNVVWQIGWLIAQNRITLADVLAKTNYSPGHFLRLFRDSSGKMQADRKSALEQLVKHFDNVPSRFLDQDVTEDTPSPVLTANERNEILSRDTMGAPSKKKLPPAVKAVRRDIEILSHLIQAALPLAEWMNSDQCTEEDRQILRQLTKEGWQDGTALFRLSTALNGLCSKKAHELQQGKRG